MADIAIIVFLLVAIAIGELLFRQMPGAGGLLYNISGTFGGLLWVVAGIYLAWGGAELLGGVIIVIGVNIHRSNYRVVSSQFDGRSRLNG